MLNLQSCKSIVYDLHHYTQDTHCYRYESKSVKNHEKTRRAKIMIIFSQSKITFHQKITIHVLNF